MAQMNSLQDNLKWFIFSLLSLSLAPLLMSVEPLEIPSTHGMASLCSNGTWAWICPVLVYSDLRALEGTATVHIYGGTLISGYFTQVNLCPNYLSASPMRVSSPKRMVQPG